MKTEQNNGSTSKIWLQELKTNKKTQGAMVMFFLVVSYLGYELFAPNASSPAKKRPNNTQRSYSSQPLEDAQITAIQRLPNLSRLDKAGELPSEDRMYRDLFRFDAPPPPPPPPKPVVVPPPKPPPTPEEIAAAERKAAMDREVRGQPSAFQMIAVVQGFTGPLKGAFKKDKEDEIHFFIIGDEATPSWVLAALNEDEASFQNTKFEELKYSIKVQTTRPGQSSNQRQASNLF
ncbi:MAG: hypothetical protein FWG02_01230 [Holophagaceae bacterium]|nr:hypothetical protein [Holophagaceae bacterium]